MIERVVVGAGMDQADNWIAERAGRGDYRHHRRRAAGEPCVKAGAVVIAPNGKPFTDESIGMRWRRAICWIRCAAPARSPAGRSRSRRATAPAFLAALDQAIVRLTREGFG